jgi:hypothetical protein
MKKRILLFSIAAGMITITTLTSSRNGAGSGSHFNATGSETGLGNINGCKASGCHGTAASTGITVSIELDSAGIPRHYYTPGITYIVKITGTNTTANLLPNFGFQMSCIKGATAMPIPLNAGTFATTGLPTGVQYTPASINFLANMIEHSTAIPATTGTGGAGTTYVESFSWTAPVAGTGTISFWGALNAVDNSSDQTGDFWNTNKLVVTEGRASVTGLATAVDNDISISAFPNPAINNLNLQLNNAQPGTYALQIINLNGSTIATQSIEVNNASTTASMNTASWTPGVYHVVVTKDGNSKSMVVVKQ